MPFPTTRQTPETLAPSPEAHEEFQPRFVAYALSIGLSPEDALAKLMGDRMKMIPFLSWIGARKDEFTDREFVRDHDGFTAYCLGYAAKTAVAA